MLEGFYGGSLQVWDTRLLLAINHSVTAAWLAKAVDLLADDAVLITLVLALGAWFWRRGAEGKRVFLALLLTVVAVNLLNTFLVKPFFGRPRPWDAVPGLIVRVSYRSLSKSFPSTHTAMACAAAMLVGLRLKPWGWLAWPMALGIMFFCVYSGGHYPLDVVAGALLGLAAASITLALLRRWESRPAPGKESGLSAKGPCDTYSA